METITRSKDNYFNKPRPRVASGIHAEGVPELGEPVLAIIESIGELGRSEWREVVYHDGDAWCSYAGSHTFDDGERVMRWIYAQECI